MSESNNDSEAYFVYFNDIGNVSGIDSLSSLKKAEIDTDKMVKQAEEKGHRVENMDEMVDLVLQMRKRNFVRRDIAETKANMSL